MIEIGGVKIRQEGPSFFCSDQGGNSKRDWISCYIRIYSVQVIGIRKRCDL